MRSFEQDRIIHDEIVTEYFKHPIPVAYVKPLQETQDTCIFIFNTGMDGTIAGSLYMNHPFYNNHYFVCFDRLNHGTNKNKPSQYKHKYLTELYLVVKRVKEKFPNKKIYVIGESWGAAIAFLYHKKYPNTVSGAFGWNMPTKPLDPEKKTAKQMWSISWRQLCAFLFKAPLLLPPVQSNYGLLTRDELLIRAKNLVSATPKHTFTTLACWRFMFPSKRYMFKYGKNPYVKFMYVQSGQDVMFDRRNINIYPDRMDNDHYAYITTGYHLLSLERMESNDLYNLLAKFISKK